MIVWGHRGSLQLGKAVEDVEFVGEETKQDAQGGAIVHAQTEVLGMMTFGVAGLGNLHRVECYQLDQEILAR